MMKCTNDPALIEKEVSALYSIPAFSAQIMNAYKTYLRRKYQLVWPDGGTERDHRWHPNANEQCECCAKIRRPSRQFPYTLLHHCKTTIHIANLYEIELKALRNIISCHKDFETQIASIGDNKAQRRALIDAL